VKSLRISRQWPYFKDNLNKTTRDSNFAEQGSSRPVGTFLRKLRPPLWASSRVLISFIILIKCSKIIKSMLENSMCFLKVFQMGLFMTKMDKESISSAHWILKC
jgi:hypothetical protein